ncbi:MAG: hypothetical protein JO223_18580 [Hyphomicrobiales bacterium]|nr:hypothetical protein [Hyphomicrobiales bacterium]MBV8443046.1 hypothetical protein [Hyphomicrobiales bacterium]
MTDDAMVSWAPIRRWSNCSSPTTWKAPAPIPVVLAAAAFALAGCNANQSVNVSSQRLSGVTAGSAFPNYNAYNPIEYAQTSGFYGGR